MNSFMASGILLATSLLPFSASASLSAPDWAERMAGHWRGEGVRVDVATGSQILVEVDVNADWHPEFPLPAIVSRNHFKETTLDAEGNPLRTKEYDRVYWVRESARQDSRAEILLGAGIDSTGPIGSRGSFDAANLLMIVQQDLGSGIRVTSQSDMSNPGLTLYTETLWMGGRKKTQSEIRYQREP
jgi:hypothetical protein